MFNAITISSIGLLTIYRGYSFFMAITSNHQERRKNKPPFIMHVTISAIGFVFKNNTIKQGV